MPEVVLPPSKRVGLLLDLEPTRWGEPQAVAWCRGTPEGMNGCRPVVLRGCFRARWFEDLGGAARPKSWKVAEPVVLRTADMRQLPFDGRRV